MKRDTKINISIIIPVYKVEAYIERCIKSVITQEGIGSAYNLECILVDDCTPDDSMEIAKEIIKPYGNIHFICLRHEVNRGLSVARNTGLEYATGEYIMFIDSDDYILPKCLKLFTDEIIKNQAIDMVVGSTINNNKTDIRKRELLETRESIIHGFLTMKYFITVWNKLIRRECITENKLLFIDNIYLQDQPWLYNLVSHIDSMLLLPNTTYFYEVAPNSASHGALTPEKAQRYVDSWNKVFDYYLSHRPSSKDFKHNLEVDFLAYCHLTCILYIVSILLFLCVFGWNHSWQTEQFLIFPCQELPHLRGKKLPHVKYSSKRSDFLRFYAYLCHVIDDFACFDFAALRQVKNLT